jgi:hypothetical protein
MSCQFTHLDGAYVLGALSPAERQGFEQHLAGCAECAQAVRELAGLPGLLARVDRDVLESPPAQSPVPDSLLPALVEQVRRARRRRTFVTAGLATAAAAVVAVGTLGVTGAFDNDQTPRTSQSPTPTPTPAAGQAMLPVGSVPVRASVVFETVAWGTRLDLTCTYVPSGSEYHPGAWATYVLVVQTRDGRTEQVGTWRALPGTTMHLSAATSASRQDISQVEVRTEKGTPVLKLAT